MNKLNLLSKLLTSFVLLFLPASCALDPGTPARAFVICVGLDYSGTRVNELIGTRDDALETAVCLGSLYRSRGMETQVEYLTSCTAEDVKALLESLDPGQNDFLVFYWSGHGHRNSRGMFLVCYPYADETYSRLYMCDLVSFAESLPCPSLILLDCCYAGCAEDGFEFSFTGDRNLRKSAVVASCAEDELSLMTHIVTVEGTSQAHSVFTVALLEVLGWNHSIDITTTLGSLTAGGFVAPDPGRISAAELGNRIINKLGERSQNPVFGRTDVPVFIVP